MMGRKFREAMARRAERWVVVKLEPQGLEGLFTKIALVFLSIKLSSSTTSISHDFSGCERKEQQRGRVQERKEGIKGQDKCRRMLTRRL